jgi:hypothetical protein
LTALCWVSSSESSFRDPTDYRIFDLEVGK